MVPVYIGTGMIQPNGPSSEPKEGQERDRDGSLRVVGSGVVRTAMDIVWRGRGGGNEMTMTMVARPTLAKFHHF